ncbi:armadillo repeat-containing protein 6 homolog isoform X1 [Lycorma delicatula]|uniref:armadillo repeat-containing protein 6 homolog isoform X1 n=1 Tax=Lycorma delicatula TaxID=130591 RepID=UPI003F5124FE
MVRVITQETFNEVIKENMEEFNMTMAEAIEEAVQQFEAQGVDLSNIIKSGDLGQDSNPIVQCLHQLKEVNDIASDNEHILSELKFLQDECQKDIAKKILAGKEGAYNILLDLLEKSKANKEVEVQIYRTLTSIMTGYPDLFDERGVNILSSTLAKTKDLDILKSALKWCRECCIKHENNRQIIFNSCIVINFKTILKTALFKEVCGVIRSLCLDDDVRINVSKAHEHARTLAVDLLCPLTELLKELKDKKEELCDVLLTISTLMVRNEFCTKVYEVGILQLIADIMSSYHEDEKITRTCMILLKTLAGNDDVKAHIIQQKNSLITLIMHSIGKHQRNPVSAATGLGLIAALALRNPSNCKIICDLGAAELICNSMKMHPQDINVQRRGCWAARNIVSRNKELKCEFLKLGIEELLLFTMKQFKECNDDAKAALRDLGCSVKLIEQWTGKGLGCQQGVRELFPSGYSEHGTLVPRKMGSGMIGRYWFLFRETD